MCWLLQQPHSLHQKGLQTPKHHGWVLDWQVTCTIGDMRPELNKCNIDKRPKASCASDLKLV